MCKADLIVTQMNDRLVNGGGGATIAAAFLLLTAAASAQTVCVRCTGPDQTYACTAIADDPVPDAALGLFCVSRIAGEHNHASCSIERSSTSCDGLAVSFDYDENAVPGAAANADPKPETADTPNDGEPRTLGEFTKETVDASAKAVKKAGENIGESAANAGKAAADAIKSTGKTVGNATKKTLKCLGSALNDC